MKQPTNPVAEYKAGLSEHTIARQRSDIRSFVESLKRRRDLRGKVFLYGDESAWIDTIEPWAMVRAEMVEDFKVWLKDLSYDLDSIGVMLATVKSYCRLAASARVLPADEYALIRLVKGYKGLEATRIDQKRGRGNTRHPDTKKAEPVFLTDEQVEAILASFDTRTLAGARDMVLALMLFELGWRRNRCAGALIENLKKVKVDGQRLYQCVALDTKRAKETTFLFTPRLTAAVDHWLLLANLKRGPILRGVTQANTARKDGLNTASVWYIVQRWGKVIGIKIAPHDGRHTWADNWHDKLEFSAFKAAGDWSSVSQPLKYVNQKATANTAVIRAMMSKSKGGEKHE